MTALLALSIGCPAGVGAEVALAACNTVNASWRAVLFGDEALLRERAPAVSVEPSRLRRVATATEARDLPADAIAFVQASPPLSSLARVASQATAEGGAAQLAWIDAATDAVVRGEAHALVTAPASKHAIATSGAPGSASFLGHTEHLGARLGGSETVMAFWADTLTISLATTHLPLARVASVMTIDDVARAAYWTARFVDDLAVDPSLAVAVLALNPHAGEGGLLGHEESTLITPGIEAARARLSRESRKRTLVGPVPGESAIRKAARDRAYAACVAMYHDQATIPSKLLAFGDAVNVTLGLPIIRTSVDHGTAYDIAGTGRADARGMIAALDLAARMVG